MRIVVEVGCAKVRTCVTCKWVEEGTYPFCQHPNSMALDPVSGKTKSKHSCHYHRTGEPRPFCWFSGACGNVGRWWEAKDG